MNARPITILLTDDEADWLESREIFDGNGPVDRLHVVCDDETLMLYLYGDAPRPDLVVPVIELTGAQSNDGTSTNLMTRPAGFEALVSTVGLLGAYLLQLIELPRMVEAGHAP